MEKFVFKVLETNKQYIGVYEKDLVGNIIVELLSDLDGNEHKEKLTTDKVEKLYTWNS